MATSSPTEIGSDGADPTGTAAHPIDPGALIRSKEYRVQLVFAALLGVLVSFASWCFLELVHWIQHELYQALPSDLGLGPVPW